MSKLNLRTAAVTLVAVFAGSAFAGVEVTGRDVQPGTAMIYAKAVNVTTDGRAQASAGAATVEWKQFAKANRNVANSGRN
jgi:hypothetical protein